jgi:hypothetical protein
MPISVAYCHECIVAGAYPYELVVAQVAMVGGDGGVLDNVCTEYIPIVHDTLNHLGYSMEDFEKAVKSCRASFADAMQPEEENESNVRNDDTNGANESSSEASCTTTTGTSNQF